MTDEERTEEPTNRQLANFLVVQARQDPRMQGLDVDAGMLEFILDRDPIKREAALLKHQRFVGELQDHLEKVQRGQVQCEHIRQNGRRCPNFNEPGSYYCGLHKGEEDGSAAS